MKHKHHIIPKHMGGSDDPSNLVELTIEEHAEAHKKLYEKYGYREDYIAWKGLSGLMTSDECAYEAMRIGSLKGIKAAIESRWGGNYQKNPTGKWIKPGIPSPYEKGIDGRKIRAKRYWYNNGKQENQFELCGAPSDWNRGRLKSVLKKMNPHVS